MQPTTNLRGISMARKETKFDMFGTHRKKKNSGTMHSTYNLLSNIENSITQGRITTEDEVVEKVENCIQLLRDNIEELIDTLHTKNGCGDEHQYAEPVYTFKRMAVCYVNDYSRTCTVCSYTESFTEVKDWFIENHPDDEDYDEVEEIRKPKPKPKWCTGAKYYETHDNF
jgi:hypothetical protein